MTKFEALLAVHLLAAVTWVGGNVYFHLLWVRAEKSTDVSNLGFLGQNAEWIGNRFFIPSSLLLLVTGILMVEDIEGYSYGDFWISFAIAVLVLSFVVGAGFLGPQGGKLGQMLQTEGLTDATRAQMKKVVTVARIELLFLLLVVVDMAIKPGLG